MPIAFIDVDNTLIKGVAGYHFTKRVLVKARPGDLPRLIDATPPLIRLGKAYFIESLLQSRSIENDLMETVPQLIESFKEMFPDDREAYKHLSRHLDHRVLDRAEALGMEPYLISAAPKEIIRPLANGLKIRYAASDYQAGKLLYKDKKLERAINVCNEEGIDLWDCAAFSDSKSDLPLLNAVRKRHWAHNKGWNPAPEGLRRPFTLI